MTTINLYPVATGDTFGDWSLNGLGSTDWQAMQNDVPQIHIIERDTTPDYYYFEFSPLTSPPAASANISAGSIIEDITVTFGATTDLNEEPVFAAPALKVNGISYNTTAPQVNINLTSYNNYSYRFATNPDTGVAWTVDDVNGLGSSPLQQIGVYTSTNNSYSGLCIYYLTAVITYNPPSQSSFGGYTIWSSDDCGWWWVAKESDPLGAPLDIRSAKIGMVRARYSQYLLIPSEGDVQSFVAKILDGPTDLVLNIGQLVYINESTARFLTLDNTTLDMYHLTFSPSSTLNPPLFLRDEEFVIDYEGYGSSTYRLYVTSAHEKWKSLGQHYWGSIIASTEPINDEELLCLKGRIDGISVSAQYLGYVKIKSTMSYELNRPLPYVEQPVTILNTVQGAKRTIVSGVTSESRYSGGSLVCGFVWQADYLNCEPIYLGIEFLTDADVMDYFDQITLKVWIVPKALDINKMVQSGRIDIPMWPDRYFYTTQGSMIGILPTGEFTGYGLNKIYQISTSDGVIGGIMPSIGDNIFVLLESNPLNKLIPDEMASIGKVPISIKRAAAIVKRPSGGPSLLIDLDATESTMTTNLSHTTTTLTSTISTTLYLKKDYGMIPYPMTSFNLPLTTIEDVGISNVYDKVYGAQVTVNADINAKTGLQYAVYVTDTAGFFINGGSFYKVDEGSIDTILTGPDFIFSTDLLIDTDIDYSTMNLELYNVMVSASPLQGTSVVPTMISWFTFGFYRVGHFWILFCELGQVSMRDFCTKFALKSSTIPVDTWFNLKLTRNKDTNAYTWYLNNEVVLDRRSRECGWDSESYWFTDPIGGLPRGGTSMSSNFFSCADGKTYCKNILLQRGTSLSTVTSPYYISDCAGVMSTAPTIEDDWIPEFYYIGNAVDRYEDTTVSCSSNGGSPGFITKEDFLHDLCLVNRHSATIVEETIPGSMPHTGNVRWEYGWTPSYIYYGDIIGYQSSPDGGLCMGLSSYARKEDGSGYEFREVKAIVHPNSSLGRDPMRMSSGYRVEMYLKFPDIQFVCTLLHGYAVENTADNIVPWDIVLSYYNGNEVSGAYGIITVEGYSFHMGPDFYFPQDSLMKYFRFEREKASNIIRIYLDGNLLQDVNGDDCEYEYDRTLLEIDSMDEEYCS